MKKTLLFALFLSGQFIGAASFAGDLKSVPGTCRVESAATNMCHCDFVEYDHISSGSVTCSILSCEDYAPNELPSGTISCQSIHDTASCVLANPPYGINCIQEVSTLGNSAQQACDDVLQCLQNFQCIKNYCQSTTIRGLGWGLKGIIRH